MDAPPVQPVALFPEPNGNIYSDLLICTGDLPAEFDGAPCPHARSGKFPGLIQLNADSLDYAEDKGEPGDLIPICAASHLQSLAHWQGYRDLTYPDALLPLRLFMCKAGLWCVVPGLRHDDAKRFHGEEFKREEEAPIQTPIKALESQTDSPVHPQMDIETEDLRAKFELDMSKATADDESEDLRLRPPLLEKTRMLKTATNPVRVQNPHRVYLARVVTPKRKAKMSINSL